MAWRSSFRDTFSRVSGVGVAPAGYGPFGAGTQAPLVEPPTVAVSCRLIDPIAMDYVTDANGNPLPYDGTADRVYVLCSYNDMQSAIITPAVLQTRQRNLVLALQPLTQGAQPAISGLSVAVAAKPDGNGVSVVVRYTNNATSLAVAQVIQ